MFFKIAECNGTNHKAWTLDGQLFHNWIGSSNLFIIMAPKSYGDRIWGGREPCFFMTLKSGILASH
jgi:hypothetical protein